MSMKTAGWVTALAFVLCVAGLPANAEVRIYSFDLNGPSENPANSSPGTGLGQAIYDTDAHTLTLSATFGGLVGNVTATHFHAVTAVSGLPDNNPIGETPSQAAAAVPNVGIAVGNPSLPGFPLGVMNGTYAQVLDLTDPSIYNSGFLTNSGGTAAGAEAAFAGALASARTYWNIHSGTYPGGEIRGFPVLIPEPGTAGLVAIGVGMLMTRRMRRRK